MVIDASTTPNGVAVVLVYEHKPGQYSAHVALGVGTSQEGEAMTLLLGARRLAA